MEYKRIAIFCLAIVLSISLCVPMVAYADNDSNIGGSSSGKMFNKPRMIVLSETA